MEQAVTNLVRFGTVKVFYGDKNRQFGFVYMDDEFSRPSETEAFFHRNGMGHPVVGNDGMRMVPYKGKAYRPPVSGNRIAFVLGKPGDKGERIRLWCPASITQKIQKRSKTPSNRRPLAVS